MIIITGASRGIGLFLRSKLLDEGNKVFGIYNSTVPTCIDDDLFKIDITDIIQIENFLNKIRSDLKELILINCAGINYNSYAHKADVQKWVDVIKVNLIGTFNMIHSILPIMREQNFGRIINFSSIVAQIGVPGTSAYASSKAALWGLTKAISIENASKGITINNLNLGYFQIGMIEQIPIREREGILQRIPVKNFGDPFDILNAVKYLINCSYITGTSLDINGGLF